MSNRLLEEIEKLKSLLKEQADKINLLEAVINDIPGSIYWKDKNGVFLGCNTFSIEKLKSQGINQDSLIGRKNEDLFPEEISRQYERHDAQIINTGLEVCVEEKAPDGKGGFLIQLSYKKPLKDPKGNIIGIMGNTVDITHLKLIESDLKKTKKQLEIANKVKTEFLQNMRHDIRTPITGIIGCARLIKKSSNNLSNIEKYSNILIESSQTLLDFLNDILDSVQVASGEIPLLKKKFNLELVLAEVIKINQAKACEKELDLTLEYDHSIPKYLIGDHRRLYRIVLELITNALKYTKQGSVVVSANLAKNNDGNVIVKIAIKDTGIGIPIDNQKEIFTRFKRLAPASQGIYQGTGLGLSIVKQFLDDLNAEIYVTSETNKGSIFTCVIPFKEALLAEEFGSDLDIKPEHQDTVDSLELLENLPSLEINPASRRVLLVEDHAITAKITKAILSDFNHQIDIANTGGMAIDLTEKNHYDIVFMDIGLPDMNGCEVTQKVRSGQKNKSVPIIGLTSHVSNEDKQHCIDMGMNAVFIKPLMQEKIEDIFNIFVSPEQNGFNANKISIGENNDNEALFDLTGNIIDLKAGVQFADGSEASAYEFLNMFINSLPEELAKMDTAYKVQDWETVKSVLHKLRGGASYCGVPRFKEACARFDNYLSSGKKELTEALYQQLLSEFNKLKQTMK